MGQVYDVPINEVGRAQIEGKLDKIKALAPEAIISSPLRRTLESAEIVGTTLDLPIETDSRLKEISMGSLSGEGHVNAAAMMGMSPKEFEIKYRSGKYDYSSQAGESAAEVEARARAFIKDLKEKQIESVLLVCHGGLIRMLHWIITDALYPMDNDLPNAVLVALDYE